MQSQNEYIGDDNFKKFLTHYDCPTPLNVVKMKFAGAICSPNVDLRPTDVISSFWREGEEPRLETKKEAELFFKFFMGLWDKIFQDIGFNKLKLPKNEGSRAYDIAINRYDEIELGFLEGFWGGQENLKIPAYIAQIVDQLSELADVYEIIANRAQKGEADDVLIKTLHQTDAMVQKAVSFVIENFTLPKIKNISSVSLKL